jgi:hypothetical protein
VYNTHSFISEAQEALDTTWFIQSIVVHERTNFTVTLRLYIYPKLFVHAFKGEITDSLYFSLIEGNQRIFGIDREGGKWHLHPFNAPHKHEPFEEGLGPKPLLSFLSKIEKLIIENGLL